MDQVTAQTPDINTPSENSLIPSENLPDLQPTKITHKWFRIIFGFGILLLLLGVILYIISSIGFQSKSNNISNQPTLPPIRDTISPIPWPTQVPPDQNGDPFTISFSGTWRGTKEDLRSDCTSILIRHYSSQESSFSAFMKSRNMYSENTNFDQLLLGVPETDKFTFTNLRSSDVYFLGAQGEGEMNNIYIKDSTGYYWIHVNYIGPTYPIITPPEPTCRPEKNYKEVLSTFKFIN